MAMGLVGTCGAGCAGAAVKGLASGIESFGSCGEEASGSSLCDPGVEDKGVCVCSKGGRGSPPTLLLDDQGKSAMSTDIDPLRIRCSKVG